MNSLFMNKTEILKDIRVTETIQEAVQQNLNAKMCHMIGGMWIRNTVYLVELSATGVVCRTFEEDHCHFEKLQINQPVGISFQIEHEKFIFDTTVMGFESSVATKGGRILLEMPDRIEKMPRRAYERQAVPEELNVHVLFWHRGHIDNVNHSPTESYWQGKMINLSAGGTQVAVSSSLADCFTPGQLIGMQFTPMFYQKPILVEAQIIHLKPDNETGKLFLGLEFLGLEVSIDGRNILHRLMDVVEEYAKMNKDKNSGVQDMVD